MAAGCTNVKLKMLSRLKKSYHRGSFKNESERTQNMFVKLDALEAI